MSEISATSKSVARRSRYQPGAYEFVFAALRYMQLKLRRFREHDTQPEDDAHITGQELLEGVRQLALNRFGLMTLCVFHHWGVYTTEDFGRIVFELIERGEMRKTARDQPSDFFDVYDFEEEFDRRYQIDTSQAFE